MLSSPELPSKVADELAIAKIRESGLFDTDWYLEQNPDVQPDEIGPIKHYVMFGVAEGRDPNPFFWTRWYLAKHPELREAAINPLIHYLESGAYGGSDPSPLFNSKWYIDQNPDVAAATINPLCHYLERGYIERRRRLPPEWALTEALFYGSATT